VSLKVALPVLRPLQENEDGDDNDDDIEAKLGAEYDILTIMLSLLMLFMASELPWLLLPLPPMFMAFRIRRRASLDLVLERYRVWRQSRRMQPTFSRATPSSTAHQRPSSFLTKAAFESAGWLRRTTATMLETMAVFSTLDLAAAYWGRKSLTMCLRRLLPSAFEQILPRPHTTESSFGAKSAGSSCRPSTRVVTGVGRADAEAEEWWLDDVDNGSGGSADDRMLRADGAAREAETEARDMGDKHADAMDMGDGLSTIFIIDLTA